MLMYNVVDHAALPAPTDDVDYFAPLPDDLGMMGNDTKGNCGACGVAHLIQEQSANNGNAITLTTDEVDEIYKILTLEANGVAYDPNDPTTDTGLVLLDVLTHWRKTGFMIRGVLHKIGAFVKVNHHNVREMRQATEWFGGTYTGVALPQAAMDTVGQQWDAKAASGPIAGGHCMTAAKCNKTGGITYVTWGRRQPADWAWMLATTDEAYAIISDDWVTGVKPAPSHLDIVRLRAYLVSIDQDDADAA
jgi:hypothetical protein